jgi:hypothetical protein
MYKNCSRKSSVNRAGRKADTHDGEQEDSQSSKTDQTAPYLKSAMEVVSAPERSFSRLSVTNANSERTADSEFSLNRRKSYIRNVKSKRNKSVEESWGNNIDLLGPETDEEYEVVYQALSNMHDLYQPENIIGYTQAASNILPTIYYRTDDLHGSITQEHSNPMNVGVSIPIKSNNYTFGNRAVESVGEVLFEEEATLGYSHMSRSKFVPISIATDDKFVELVDASEKHVNIKRIYNQFGFEFIRRASGL